MNTSVWKLGKETWDDSAHLDEARSQSKDPARDETDEEEILPPKNVCQPAAHKESTVAPSTHTKTRHSPSICKRVRRGNPLHGELGFVEISLNRWDQQEGNSRIRRLHDISSGSSGAAGLTVK